MILHGKIALITGAARGVGRANAIALAAAGACVVVNDVGGSAGGAGADPLPAQEVADAINASGGRAIPDGTDISSWMHAHRLVDGIVERFGQLDILVNNAGICRPTAFGRISEDDWDRTLDVNAKGTAALIEAAVRHWQRQGTTARRAIVNTASGAGTHPHAPLGLYGVSKAAVLTLTQVAAEELAQFGVRVNAVGPVARTRMVGQAMAGRSITTEQIMPLDPDYDLYDPAHVARLVLYLASPLCEFTGRMFGVRADDIVLYREWDAHRHVNNGRRAWSLETLAAALSALPKQEPLHLLGPAGVQVAPWPSNETFTQLTRATSSRG
jgi:NAD(P)-dependent dehydrogenase (short-subunit alcohol dehydrogenase family)